MGVKRVRQGGRDGADKVTETALVLIPCALGRHIGTFKGKVALTTSRGICGVSKGRYEIQAQLLLRRTAGPSALPDRCGGSLARWGEREMRGGVPAGPEDGKRAAARRI